MKKIIFICTLLCFCFNAGAKEISVNDMKLALGTRGYEFKYIPETKAYLGEKKDAASVQIFPYDNNAVNVRNIIYSINASQDPNRMQEELLTAAAALSLMADNQEKVTQFLINSLQNIDSQRKQETVIGGKTFSFYLLGSFIMIIAGEQ